MEAGEREAGKMKKPITFDARITKARKPHKCYACECDIPTGQVYIAYPGTSYEGKFQTVHLCIECSFLLTQKDGADARTIEQGNFTEQRIPNCLRKKRNEFRRDPKGALDAVGLLNVGEPVPPKRCQQIVVKASELDRRIFHVPESRYKVEQFVKGATLALKAGVMGEVRSAVIKGAWSTDGSGFGCNKRQVAVLVA